MIPLVTLADEELTVSRGRYAGRKTRQRTVIAVDKYNITIAVGGDTLLGKKFVGRLEHLPGCLEELGLDEEDARKKTIDFFREFKGAEISDDITWIELDKEFQVAKRTEKSDGVLDLYHQLKAKYGDDEETE